jgi:hypothetical protein
MKNIISILILTSILFSCISEEEKKTEKEKNAKELSKQEKEKVIDKLVSKYNITYSWDTLGLLHYRFSVDFNPIINSKYQLIERININDIYEKDSIKYISIKSGFYPAFYFDFPITMEQEIKLRQKDNDIILVVSISSIRKIKLSLEGEIEDSENARVHLENSKDFIGKGKIIDIVTLKKQTTE